MDLTNIIDFIKSYNSSNLIITNDKDIITFTKNKEFYTVKLFLADNQLIFNPINDDPYMVHFIGILNKANLNMVDQLPELIDFIIDFNINNYCAICYTKLDFQSDTLVHCENSKCVYAYEELIIGNNVIDKFIEDKNKCKFLLASAIDAMTCERKYDIFEPFPTHFLKNKNINIERGKVSKLEGNGYDGEKDFDFLNKTIKGIDIKKLTKLILEHKTKKDIDLANNIGKDLYILIRFILMSCKVDITNNDNTLSITPTSFKLYKITNPYETEEEFKNMFEGKPTGFLFHGSRWCNWYSILRNGLKNCSKSTMQVNGSVYGSGVYLSNDITLSYGYGLSGKKSVVGVFELLDREKYKKANTIYVVDNEKVLVQRYLLIIPSSGKHEFAKEINPLFNKQIYEHKFNATVQYSKKSLMRIAREYKTLTQSNPDKSAFRIEMDPNFPFEWKIFFSKFDEKYMIAKDMKKLSVKEIELEIRFPTNFPFGPPFIRVVEPRFARLTGHVIATSGAFCNELLTDRGWSPACTVESLVIVLMSEIIEGEGRLDPVNYNVPYNYEEAKKDFVRVAKSHGWI